MEYVPPDPRLDPWLAEGPLNITALVQTHLTSQPFLIYWSGPPSRPSTMRGQSYISHPMLHPEHRWYQYTVKAKVAQSCPTLCNPIDYIQFMEFSRPEHWSGHPFPFPGDLPHPGTEPRSPALEADSLPAKPQEKPKNTGMGGLSLLQGIFLTQELNGGLLHCRRTLHQLSYYWYLV